MKSLVLRSFFLVAGLVAVVAVSCKKDSPEVKPNHDRTAFIDNIGLNIILPAYQSLSTAADSLDLLITLFNNNPSSDRLTAVQQKLKRTWLAYQRCAPFGFGPASQVILDKNINIFPTNPAKITNNISNVDQVNLSQLTNLDAKGFPALDYMLFGLGADHNAILARYATAGDAGNTRKYLAALSADVKKLTTQVLTGWISSGGNYINTFQNATGTDVGSALGQITNGMAYDLDILKNYEVAIPVGIMPASGSTTGTPLPQEVLGYFSGISSELMLAEVLALQNIYLGKGVEQDSAGIDDYLVTLKATYGGGSLHDAINLQFTTAIAKVKSVPDPLSETIQNNPNLVKSTYTELQKLLVLLKTDMPSAMGVLITFEDNDGD